MRDLATPSNYYDYYYYHDYYYDHYYYDYYYHYYCLHFRFPEHLTSFWFPGAHSPFACRDTFTFCL